MAIPILYSQPDSPHALRARLALLHVGLRCELREVDPAAPPLPLPALPLLQLPSGRLLTHSIDILRWAAEWRPELGLWPESRVRRQAIDNLIQAVDGPFAEALDNYRQATSRGLVRTPRELRGDGEVFLAQLEARIARTGFLVGGSETLADLAVLPFVHHFAEVDRAWFDGSPYLALRSWLARHCQQPWWPQALARHPFWHPGADPVHLDSRALQPGSGSGQA
jgi:glutathione S-transferase